MDGPIRLVPATTGDWLKPVENELTTLRNKVAKLEADNFFLTGRLAEESRKAATYERLLDQLSECAGINMAPRPRTARTRPAMDGALILPTERRHQLAGVTEQDFRWGAFSVCVLGLFAFCAFIAYVSLR